jgi:hypothetical protein
MTDTRIHDWNDYDWDRESLAVVASDGGGTGCVLWTAGPHVQFEQQETGCVQLEDLGLDDAPLGISIWAGQYLLDGLSAALCDVPDSCTTHPRGRFRPPTDEEWAAIRAGRCPWRDEDWYASSPAPAPQGVPNDDEAAP